MGTASAQLPTRVLVGNPPPEVRDATIRASGARGIAVVDPPAGPSLSNDTGEEALASARRAYEELEPAAASALMQRWWQAVDAGEWHLQRERLIDAALLTAAVELALGGDPAPWMARARTIAPELTLDPSRHSPPFRAAFEGTPIPTLVEVRWGSLPPGASVRVDGGPRAPLAEVSRLPAGRHWLELRAPGMTPNRWVVTVRENEPVPLVWEPDPTAPLRHDGASLEGAQREAARALGLVALRVSWDGERLTVEDGLRGRTTVEGASLDDAWALVWAVWDRPTDDPSEARRRRRAVGLGVGAAVVVALATAVTAVVVRRRGDRGWQLSAER